MSEPEWDLTLRPMVRTRYPTRTPGRWVLACINWSHPDAPHAALFRVGAGGMFDREFYLPTFADAIALADRIRRREAGR